VQSASRRPFASVTRRGGLDDFVDLVIPELQQRGLFRTEYEGASSHQTRRWRRESRANPSLKWGSRAWQYGTIPRGLWMITEAEKGYFGLENGGISVFAPWQLLLLSRS
jgi:hypothetical protein